MQHIVFEKRRRWSWHRISFETSQMELIILKLQMIVLKKKPVTPSWDNQHLFDYFMFYKGESGKIKR
jgi:hypothetical protein